MALLIKTFYKSVTSWRPWIYISLWFLYPTQDGCSSPIFIQEHLLLWSNVWNMSSSSTLVRKPSGVRFLSAAAKMAWASGLSTIGRPRWNWPLTLTQRGQWLCKIHVNAANIFLSNKYITVLLTDFALYLFFFKTIVDFCVLQFTI